MIVHAREGMRGACEKGSIMLDYERLAQRVLNFLTEFGEGDVFTVAPRARRSRLDASTAACLSQAK